MNNSHGGQSQVGIKFGKRVVLIQYKVGDLAYYIIPSMSCHVMLQLAARKKGVGKPAAWNLKDSM